ncbi:MAG: hypothetical protein NZT61_03850 [Deltaproteobacteria bacterium]|nr:hypothetical protein [Deltaproteobacteria bacterium]MCX7952245.1 hypothetical protein [Deltaproteobacteria bacterium]
MITQTQLSKSRNVPPWVDAWLEANKIYHQISVTMSENGIHPFNHQEEERIGRILSEVLKSELYPDLNTVLELATNGVLLLPKLPNSLGQKAFKIGFIHRVVDVKSSSDYCDIVVPVYRVKSDPLCPREIEFVGLNFGILVMCRYGWAEIIKKQFRVCADRGPKRDHKTPADYVRPLAFRDYAKIFERLGGKAIKEDFFAKELEACIVRHEIGHIKDSEIVEWLAYNQGFTRYFFDMYLIILVREIFANSFSLASAENPLVAFLYYAHRATCTINKEARRACHVMPHVLTLQLALDHGPRGRLNGIASIPEFQNDMVNLSYDDLFLLQAGAERVCQRLLNRDTEVLKTIVSYAEDFTTWVENAFCANRA